MKQASTRTMWAVAAALALAMAGSAQEAPPAASRPVGTVKAIAGTTVTLTTDAKVEVAVQVQESTRIVRAAPGLKDLKDATPIALSEVQTGDRMLVRGTPSGDGKSIAASSIIIMSKADVAQKQQREVEDWNRRGVGGLVKSVDTAAGTITLTTSGAATAKPVLVRVGKDTVVRRYAADSVKFDDATRATLAEIKAGDQLRARGQRSEDGTEVTAEEIVAGTFHNVAGLITSVDARSGTVTVNDLATKKPVVIRIAADSDLRKLPQPVAQMVAQMMATRQRGGPQETPGGEQGFQPRAAAASGGQPGAGARPGGAPGGARNGRGGSDIQRMLSAMPALTLAELQKGDAIMVVTTQGTPGSPVTAITLLGGVEPILTAAPTGNRAAMLLTPWNLGGGGGGEEP